VRRARTLFVGAAVVAGGMVASSPGHARAQSRAPAPVQTQVRPKVTVRVRQVAGNTVYLDIGTRHGLATGDTLRAALDSLGPPTGWLVVTASTETMSVLTFIGAGLPVVSGTPLTLWLLREPVEAPPPQAVAPPRRSSSARTTERAPPSEAGVLGQPHGRFGFDLTGVRSSTQVGGLNPSSSVMRFATPGLVFDATVPDLGGGFSLRTNLRAAYRYSSGDIINPATSVRVYSAVLEKDFRHAPVRFAVGRFLSPEEVYSGFWDGGYLRLGGRSFGAGAMVGFEPDRWNERPSTKYPKATVFADAQRQGDGWRWHADASASAVRPRDSLPDHTFIGFSQRVTTRRLYLSEDLQVDRNPAGGRWRISWLQLRSSVSVGGGFRVSAGASRRESWSPWLPGSPFLPRNDRLDAGLGFWRGAGGLSAGASVNRDASGRKSYGATASYSVTRLPGLGPVGTSGVVTRWSGPFGSTMSAAPSLTLALTPAWLRLGYRYSRSDYLRSSLVTNTVEGSLDVPFAPSMRLSLTMSESWGGVLSSQYMYLSLYRIF